MARRKSVKHVSREYRVAYLLDAIQVICVLVAQRNKGSGISPKKANLETVYPVSVKRR
jgi:hypothetical protein